MAKQLFLSGTVSGQPSVWPLDRPLISVGRLAANTIQLEHDTVSKKHAEIFAEGDAWLVRDLGSKNVTRVNGVPVHDPVPLRLGDCLRFGRMALYVTDGKPASDAPLSDSQTLTTSLQIPAAELLRQGRSGEAVPHGVLRALATAGGLMVVQGPLADACDQLLRVVEEIVPASRLILLVRDRPGTQPMQMAARCCGKTMPDPLLMSRKILDRVLDSGASVITSDAMTDPRFVGSGSVLALKTRSAMAVPLYEGGRVQGVLYADQDDPGIRYGEGHLELLTLIGNMIAVKVANDRLEEARLSLRRLEHELVMAGRIQRGLLPAEPPAIPGYECHALLQSCEEVGGDLYDFHAMPDGSVYFIVGDVAGKGIAAALLMSHFLASADALYGVCEDPGDLASRLNAVVAKRTEEGLRFVTAFVGRLEPGSRVLHYANAGHPSGLLLGPGSIRRLPSTGPPCGATPSFVYSSETIPVPPGELLALFTDGIPDTRRGEEGNEEFFDVDRLVSLLARSSASEPLALLGKRVLDEVDAFLDGGARQDDVTLLLLRSAGSGEPHGRLG